jgi:hypothetical protein
MNIDKEFEKQELLDCFQKSVPEIVKQMNNLWNPSEYHSVIEIQENTYQVNINSKKLLDDNFRLNQNIWNKLLNLTVEKAEFIFFRIKAVENGVIEEVIKLIGEYEILDYGKDSFVEISGKINEDIIKLIKENYLNEKRELKWTLVSLSSSKHQLFTGSGFARMYYYLGDVDSEILNYIKDTVNEDEYLVDICKLG